MAAAPAVGLSGRAGGPILARVDSLTVSGRQGWWVGRVIGAGLLATGLWSGEAPPAVTLRCADGEALIRHFDAGIYGRLWRDPVCDPLRERLDKALADVELALGAKAPAVLTAIKGPALRIDGFAKDEDGLALPQVSLRMDMGEFAERLLVAIASRHEAVTDAGVPGALDSFVPFAEVPAILGRFGSVVVGTFGVEPERVQSWPVPPAPDDFRMVADLPRLVAGFKAVAPALDLFGQGGLQDLRGLADTRFDLRIGLVESGLHEQLTLEPMRPGLRPVDRGQLARLPANALMACAIGIDGATWWPANREDLLNGLGSQLGKGDAAATQRWLDEQLAGWGLPAGIDGVLASLDGTVLMAVTPGMPWPGVSLVVPRSAPIDRLMRALLAQQRVPVPEPGQIAPVPLADSPLPIQVVIDQQNWLITSDSAMAVAWSKGPPGGWPESVAGRVALEHARADAFLIGASDTPTVLRTIIPAAQALLSVGTDLRQQEHQAALLALVRLSSMAATGWLVAHPTDRGAVIEDQGLVGLMSLAGLGGIVAGVSEGLVMTRRALRDVTPVVDTLRNVILPAEMRFQSARHIDQDGDGIGEFGLLDELAGLRPTGRVAVGTVSLVPRDLIEGRHGHQFFVYLPSASGSTVAEPDKKDEARPADAVAAKAQARRFVAYAWPNDESAGDQVFAITQEGIVHVAPHVGGVPAWNALFGGKGWDAKPVWTPWKARSDKGR